MFLENVHKGNIKHYTFFFQKWKLWDSSGLPKFVEQSGRVWIHQVWVKAGARHWAAVMGGHMREQHHRLQTPPCIKLSSSEASFSCRNTTLSFHSTVVQGHTVFVITDHNLKWEKKFVLEYKRWAWEPRSDKDAILMLQSNDCSRGKSVALISFFRNKDEIEIHIGMLRDKGKAGEGHKARKFLPPAR